MIKIEMLYPEICNLFGDYANVKYLASCIEDVKVINTHLTDKPSFLNEDVDFIYMGSMTEKSQELVIERLKPYTEKIKEMIDKNKVMLFTGNAVEILGNYIEKDDGSKIEALGILNFYAKRQMMNRVNSLILGEFEIASEKNKENSKINSNENSNKNSNVNSKENSDKNSNKNSDVNSNVNSKENSDENSNVNSDENYDENLKIVGFKSQFTLAHGDNSNNYFIKIERGFGLDKESKLEGFKVNNLFATYLLGPILPLNPKFTKYILKLLNQKDNLKFEKEAMEAYEIRLKEFEDKNVKG